MVYLFIGIGLLAIILSIIEISESEDYKSTDDWIYNQP
jgi:hypothetical protein